MLKLLLIVPLLGILPLILINSDSSQSVSASGGTATSGQINKDANSLMKQIALGASLITLLISVVI